jgi:AbrB family looped-hinge helix DNA binding protein
MAFAQSKLTAQGRVCVPAEVRRRLGVGPGAVIEWDEKGEVIVVRRVGRYSSSDLHEAIFRRAPRAHSLDDLKKGIARHMKRRHARH